MNNMNTVFAAAYAHEHDDADIPAYVENFLDDITPLAEYRKKVAGKIPDKTWRWWIRDRDNNGLAESGALFKIRRRLYIHEALFNKWLYDNARVA